MQIIVFAHKNDLTVKSISDVQRIMQNSFGSFLDAIKAKFKTIGKSRV